MALSVFWSKKSDKRFDEIIDFLLNNWGEKSVSIFVTKIHEFIEIVGEFPEIGSLEHKELNIRAFVVVKQITIFYQLRENKIIILNLYDNRQKPKRKKF